jgi:hypothetical protein
MPDILGRDRRPSREAPLPEPLDRLTPLDRAGRIAGMPHTARRHFDDDIMRAWAMHDLARETVAEDIPLADDVGRVSVAFGVGALDAYLCDAFVDTLARCLKSCRRNGHAPPTGYQHLELPIGPLMTDYPIRSNWGLRMAARTLMEKDNLLQLG